MRMFNAGHRRLADNTCLIDEKPRKLLPLAAKRDLTSETVLLQMTRLSLAAAAAAMLMASSAVPAAAGAAKAAFFPFEFIDSGQMSPVAAPPPADEAARLALVGGLLRDRLTGSGPYEAVDLKGASQAIAASPALRDCQSCADEIARGAGAEIAVVGYVQKVSNLILNINIRVSNAQSGQVLAAASADIRGNTDESWTRGVEWLVKNRLLAKLQP
jgi:hypothetical protein